MAQRTSLFPTEPLSELRGLASLTDPDDGVAAVIDLAVMGARGDGKTQFLVHAIRALHAREPSLPPAEHELDRSILRLVLDPRAPRPDATPPGVVPHFTFRVRAASLFDRLAWPGALRLAIRLGGVGALVVVAALLVVSGLALGVARSVPPGVIVTSLGAALGGIAALVARRRIERAGELEIVFWDVAGEQIYSPAAADYHALMGRLVDARRARAEELGRGYAFAPVLICNPLGLGTVDEGSPYARLRALLPMFSSLDRAAARALVAVNRWAIVEHICRPGAPRDEVVTVRTRARGESFGPEAEVARDHVRVHCVDAEDGRDGHISVTHLRYDTAIKSSVTVDDAGALEHEYDDGPGAFSGSAHRKFLAWLTSLPSWTPRAHAIPDELGDAPAHASGADPSGTERYAPPPVDTRSPYAPPSAGAARAPDAPPSTADTIAEPPSPYAPPADRYAPAPAPAYGAYTAAPIAYESASDSGLPAASSTAELWGRPRQR